MKNKIGFLYAVEFLRDLNSEVHIQGSKSFQHRDPYSREEKVFFKEILVVSYITCARAG